MAILMYQSKLYQRMYMNLLVLVMIWLAGAALTLVHWTTPTGQPIRTSLVQGNIPQILKWSPDHVQLSLDRYTDLTKPLWQKNALIIWPEAAIPLPLQDAEAFVNGLNDQANKHQATIITGIPVYDALQDGYYNAVIALGPVRGVYLKHHLVPFGEYIPWTTLIKPIYQYINIPMTQTLPGSNKQPPLVVNGIKILTFICYEIIFPEQVRSRDPTIGLLLTVTNDAWYGRSAAQAQHLQMAQMRSIENGRPGIFVSNDGITAIIAPNGRVVAAAPQFKNYVLTENIQAMQGLTPWQRFGMDPILSLLLISTIIAARFRHTAYRFSEKNYGRTI